MPRANYHTCTPENPCDTCRGLRDAFSPELPFDDDALPSPSAPVVTPAPVPPPVRYQCAHCGCRGNETIVGLTSDSIFNRYGQPVPPYRICGTCRRDYVRRCEQTVEGERCANMTVDGHVRMIGHDMRTCLPCWTRLGARGCNVCGQGYVPDPNVPAQLAFCPSCAARHFSCPTCGGLSRRDMSRVHRTPEGVELCWNCYRRDYVQCPRCHETYPQGDSVADSIGAIGACGACLERVQEANYEWEHDNGCYQAHALNWEPTSAALRTGGSLRRFGVELEFSRSSRVAGYLICRTTKWGGCPDGTSGVCQEFKSPPINGDKGIESVELLCDMAQRMQLEVSRNCGYHLHLDMSDETELRLARIACACQVFLPLWRCFVPPSRRRNSFCASDAVNGAPEAIARGVYKPHTLDSGNRYCAWNWQAYQRHRTLENRLHTGTMNTRKVVNWIRANLAFIEWARKTPVVDILAHDREPAPRQFQFLQSKVWEGDVAEFYQGRARKFGVDLSLTDISPVPAPRIVLPGSLDWEWTDHDRRIARDYYGRDDERRLQQAYYEHRLTRRPPPFVDEIIVGTVEGYSEYEENDP